MSHHPDHNHPTTEETGGKTVLCSRCPNGPQDPAPPQTEWVTITYQKALTDEEKRIWEAGRESAFLHMEDWTEARMKDIHDLKRDDPTAGAPVQNVRDGQAIGYWAACCEAARRRGHPR